MEQIKSDGNRRKFLADAGAVAGYGALTLFFGAGCRQNNELSKKFWVRQGEPLVFDDMRISLSWIKKGGVGVKPDKNDGASLEITRSRPTKRATDWVAINTFIGLGESTGTQIYRKTYLITLLDIVPAIPYSSDKEIPCMVQLEIKQTD